MIVKSTTVLAFIVMFLIVRAAPAAEKRHAHGHVHGAAEMNIVAEGKSVLVEFRAPAEGVMGFEHEAKSDTDQKKRDLALKTIKERFAEMVIFDKKLGCVGGASEVSVVQTDEAGKDAKSAKGQAKCARGTTLVVRAIPPAAGFVSA
jgi:hypothetical protein